MKRKVLSLFIITSLMAGIFVGCAESNNTEDTSEVDSSSETVSEDSNSGESTKNLVFWDKAEYVDEYAVVMKDIVDEFASENNVEVDYVNVASSSMRQKLMAQIEAGNPPDLIVGDDVLVGRFASLDQLTDVSDIISEFDFTDAAVRGSKIGDISYLVPQAFMAPGMYVRKDVWDENNLEMPTTWIELKEQAAIVNDPSNAFYGLAFPMGASGGGDAEAFVRMIMLDWGGATVDEYNNVVVNSPENVEAFKYIASLYEDGLISPDALTGDDSWNNQAYLSGTAGIICNSGSVVAAMTDDNPELLANTQVIPMPAGPNGDTYTLGGMNTFGIIESGENTDEAKDFIRYYFEQIDQYEEMIEVMGAMWQPVINGLEDSDFWQDPNHKPWLESSKTTVRNAYPGPVDELSLTAFSDQICVKAVQEMLINGATAEEAIDGLEEAFLDLYSEN